MVKNQGVSVQTPRCKRPKLKVYPTNRDLEPLGAWNQGLSFTARRLLSAVGGLSFDVCSLRPDFIHGAGPLALRTTEPDTLWGVRERSPASTKPSSWDNHGAHSRAALALRRSAWEERAIAYTDTGRVRSQWRSQRGDELGRAMGLDFRNLNCLWASVLAETLYRLGLETAVVCPGSRSAPLAIAFAEHPQIHALPILDERSAAFFALGSARRTHRAVALICTSGTAAANFFPAVIEAAESQVPLLILSADRPPELRHCHAGQAIDQVELFGSYPRWSTELSLPNARPGQFAYLRQTLVHAWERAHDHPGPVHLNVPLREPLAPTLQPEIQALEASWAIADFFRHLEPASLELEFGQDGDLGQDGELGRNQLPFAPRMVPSSMGHLGGLIRAFWQSQRLTPERHLRRGLIIVGPAQPANPAAFSQAIAHLSQLLGWPVLSDALNPLRHRVSEQPHLICTYDFLLRQQDAMSHRAKTLHPEQVLRIGELPTSKVLRDWLAGLNSPQWVVSLNPDNLDPLHGLTRHLRTDLDSLIAACPWRLDQSLACPYLELWLEADQRAQRAIAHSLSTDDSSPLREPQIPWLLSQTLPARTQLFVANSTPIRDVEWFWQASDRHFQVFFNRGANGIDGTLSTALGLAHHAQPTVLLTGDLALLHDTNGFLQAHGIQGHLTIVLINNNGGGIFELLPIRQFESVFESFFATPQHVDIAQLCRAYGVEHRLIKTAEALSQAVRVLPDTGVRVLEVRSDRRADAIWRRQFFEQSILEIL